MSSVDLEPPRPFELWGSHLTVQLPGARALFTTRRGGSSQGPYESLNLGLKTADSSEAVIANRAALSGQVNRPLSFVRQVHGTRVLTAPGETESTDGLPEADGQATAAHGIALVVLAADCLPIVVASEGAVAAVHAGWRGLAAGVIGEGVRALRRLDGRAPVHAAIGPGAGPCCYEVGEEVHAAFADRWPDSRHGRNLDLKAIARAQLLEAGVDAVYDTGLCTICSDRSLFFSHRRDQGVTGRQAGIGWRTPTAVNTDA